MAGFIQTQTFELWHEILQTRFHLVNWRETRTATIEKMLQNEDFSNFIFVYFSNFILLNSLFYFPYPTSWSHAFLYFGVFLQWSTKCQYVERHRSPFTFLKIFDEIKVERAVLILRNFKDYLDISVRWWNFTNRLDLLLSWGLISGSTMGAMSHSEDRSSIPEWK